MATAAAAAVVAASCGCLGGTTIHPRWLDGAADNHMIMPSVYVCGLISAYYGSCDYAVVKRPWLAVESFVVR